MTRRVGGLDQVVAPGDPAHIVGQRVSLPRIVEGPDTLSNHGHRFRRFGNRSWARGRNNPAPISPGRASIGKKTSNRGRVVQTSDRLVHVTEALHLDSHVTVGERSFERRERALREVVPPLVHLEHGVALAGKPLSKVGPLGLDRIEEPRGAGPAVRSHAASRVAAGESGGPPPSSAAGTPAGRARVLVAVGPPRSSCVNRRAPRKQRLTPEARARGPHAVSPGICASVHQHGRCP